MKRPLAITVAFSTLAFASAAEARDPARSPAEFLTPAQKAQVLRAIDNICGDTWCEGDYNFRFQHIFCSLRAQSCRVVFQMFPHGEPRKARGAACDLKGVRAFAHLLRPSGELQDRIYNQLTSCIGRRERTRRPARRRR
jgi:hypothetical protein